MTEILATREHPRTIGWISTTALAMGGSNQSLFLISALFIGQGAIPGQGSAAVPLLIVGLLLALAAAPGWTELVMMWPNRVGGIAGACSEAFRPYNPVLSALTGVCYWWGWVPTCGLTAILSATAINQWYLPSIPVSVLATAIVLTFTAVNFLGIKWVVRLATPIGAVSALLAFISGIVPVLTGHVNWVQAGTFHLTTPFAGWFGGVTSLMAGLYLIGFAAPAFEAAACHVGETKDAERDVRKRGDGLRVFPDSARHMAGSARASRNGAGSDPGARPHFRACFRQHGQGRGHLVHGVQHVPRHPSAAGRRLSHALAAC